MACNQDKIMSAIRDIADRITDVTHEDIATSNKYVLGKIPDGGVVERHSKQDAIIYGNSKQAPVKYRQLDTAVKPMTAGQMKARELNGFSGIFDTEVNDLPDNACHGFTTIDFAQGFRERSAEDFGIDLDTPVKCVRELETYEKKYVRGYLEGFENSFRTYGYENFDANLMNLVIEYGEANASVTTANSLSLSSNGWTAPPTNRISIDFLENYRRHIMRTLKGRGIRVADDWKLEVEMPREDWRDAVLADQVNRYGSITGAVFNMDFYKNVEDGIMKGRSFGEWGNIRAYFNDEPIRGFFKQKGDGTYSFVRVYPTLNVVGEDGGVYQEANFQYDYDSITVDGVVYPMITLIPHIHPMSFKRWGLAKPLKTAGGDNLGVNWDVKVIDGPYIDCNERNDKFKLIGSHEFRFLAKYPEFSGFIAYRHGIRAGYVNPVTPRQIILNGTATAGPEEFRLQEIDACTASECAQCDQVVDNETLQCVDPEDADAAILALSPSGAITAVGNASATRSLRLAVTRAGGLGGAASVNYATANGTATAGSDYVAASGTLNWAAGETDPKYIDVTISANPGDGETFTVTISSPTGATIAASQNVATVTIDVI